MMESGLGIQMQDPEQSQNLITSSTAKVVHFLTDDIVLLSPSCFGLQKLLNICEQFASNWDIKFNPNKSQSCLVIKTNIVANCI